jgi:phage-related protein
VQLFEWLVRLNATKTKAVRKKCIARIRDLAREGFRLQPPLAKPLRDKIYELRPKTGRVNYRMLYFFHNEKAVITHGLTKESSVPDADIEYAIYCRKLVALDEHKYTASIPPAVFQ